MATERPSAPRRLAITVLAARLGLCRLDASEPVPGWTAQTRTFLTISRTPEELSIVADEASIPPQVRAERDYRAMRVAGPLPLEWVGVIAALAGPLAAAGVPIFPIATHDTDYVVVREGALARAVTVLVAAGHEITDEVE